MPTPREIEDIVRNLVRHQHDHPPVRDLNRELDRREQAGERISQDFVRLVGSWAFVLIQLVLVLAWLLLNNLPRFTHWDPYPYQLLGTILSLEAVLGIAIALMAHHRIARRDRMEAQRDFELAAKEENELRAIMEHLEAQDEIMLQLLYRLERSERELQRLTRGLGVPIGPR